MKKIVVSMAASLAIVLGGSAQAQTPAGERAPAVLSPALAAIDPASLKAVQDMFVAMSYRQSMESMAQQMAISGLRSIRPLVEARLKADPNLTAEQRKRVTSKLEKLNDLMPRLSKLFTEALTDPALIDELVDDSIPIYARNFSVAELNELTAFYRTPIGAKLLAVSPTLMAESMQGSQLAMTRSFELLKQKVLAMLQEQE